MSAPPRKDVQTVPAATVLFAGDSGDGMQLTGSQFTLATAHARNDLATLPDYPAEIRAPAGTTYGVSGFQLHFGSGAVRTPGDEVDLLVAMNPAALKVHLGRVRPGGSVVVNTDSFAPRDLDLAGLDANPLEDGTLEGYQAIRIALTTLTREALKDHALDLKAVDRCKNMFALGLALWLYDRPIEPARDWIRQKFAERPALRDANLHVLDKGYHFGETTELIGTRFEVGPARLAPGTYRAIRGAEALALGLVTASVRSGLPLFYGTYPITPASDILHELSRHKNFGVMTFQAEDEIAAVGAALGAAFGGSLGVTATSGPGVALKTETIGLAVMAELPLVIVDMQRGGPSTGLPTKTEQSDLLQAVYGRNGEAPLVVLAADSPGDCYRAAYEACRLAVRYMTPVMLLADGYLGSGAEPWPIPDPDALPPFDVAFTTEKNGRNDEGEAVFLPYVRDEETLARGWVRPGTPGLEHRLGGLEKEDGTGNVSYDAANHQRMTELRAAKIERVTQDLPPLEVYRGDDAPGEDELLVVGWGSTRGAIESAVERCRERGLPVASLHLRHLWPLPADLGEVLGRYPRVMVPELNNGQLVRLLRDRFLRPFIPLNKIQGRPFRASEIEAAVEETLAASDDER